MKQPNADAKGRVTLSIAEGVLTASRALLAADKEELSPLVEKLLRDYLSRQGVPTELSADALRSLLKEARRVKPKL